MLIKRLMATVAAGMSVALVVPAVAFAASSNVTVTGTGQSGWLFNRDVATQSPYEMTDDTASIGEGSLYVKPITNTINGRFDKFIAEKTVNALVTDFNSVSYDFKVAGNGDAADANQFYLNVYTNLPGSTTFYDCRFDYVPTTGSTTIFTTFTAAPDDTPTHVEDRFNGSSPTRPNDGFDCPATLEEMPSGSKVSFISLSVGDTSASLSDTGVGGYYDNVVLNVGSDTTTYDFEPVIALTNKEDCKKDGWKDSNTPVFKNQGSCVSYMQKVKSTNYTLNSNNPSGLNVPTKDGAKYKVALTGTWTNRGGEVVDAECTSWQGGPWLNEVNGGFSSDLLDVQLNEEFIDWGNCNDDTHTYKTWATGDGDDLNLRVFDGDTNTNQQIAGWFSDNVGTFQVKVTEYPKN